MPPVSATCRQDGGVFGTSDLLARKKKVPHRGAPSNDTTTADGHDPILHDDLRWLAGVIYASTSVSLAKLAVDKRFSGISKRTLERWATDDRWREKRQVQATEIRTRIEAELVTSLVEGRLSELRKLEEYIEHVDNVLLKTNDDGSKSLALAPTSLEQIFALRLKAAAYLDHLRAELADVFVAPAAPTQDPNQVGDTDRPTILHPNLRIKPTEEEALAMAMALLDVRRTRQQEEFKRLEAERAEAERSKLDVAKGKPAVRPLRVEPPSEAAPKAPPQGAR